MSAARIFRARTLECRVASFDWRFARERAEDIAQHWTKLVAQKPALFDGRVLLSCDMRADEAAGVVAATYFETSFSSFIAWRDFGFPDPAIRNGFAMAALRSADGAFLLGEMAAHTSNAGQVYFPAGTPDPSDIVGESVDLAGSVARELAEETGIDLAEGVVDPEWTVVVHGPRVAFMRPVTLAERADAVIARVAETLAQEDTPELARMIAVRSMADMDGRRAPDFLRAYLAHEFGG